MGRAQCVSSSSSLYIKVGLPASDLNAPFCFFCLSVRSTFTAVTHLLKHSAQGFWFSDSGTSLGQSPLAQPSQNEVEKGYSQIILAVGQES